MADFKWIDDLTGDVAWTNAARHVLKVRLEAVAERMPDAILRGGEYRARPPASRQHAPSGGRRSHLRRALAGEDASDRQEAAQTDSQGGRRGATGTSFSRCWCSALTAGPKSPSEGFDFLLGYAQGQRALAQTHLADMKPLIDEDHPAFLREVIDSLPDDPSLGSFREHGVPLLTSLAREMDAAASRSSAITRTCTGSASRARAPLCDGSLRSLLRPRVPRRDLSTVESMQEILGTPTTVCRHWPARRDPHPARVDVAGTRGRDSEGHRDAGQVSSASPRRSTAPLPQMADGVAGRRRWNAGSSRC